MKWFEVWRYKWREITQKVELWRFPDAPEKRVLTRLYEDKKK